MILVMVKKANKGSRFYFVQCGDWEGVTVAPSPKEACRAVVSQAVELFKEDLKFTKVMVCVDCKKSIDGKDDEASAFLTEKIMGEMHEN